MFSGVNNDDQWPGSRVISAQKANTANAFSLEGFALSSANLFAAVQPGGSLYGLQESNPVDRSVAYAGKASDFGTTEPNEEYWWQLRLNESLVPNSMIRVIVRDAWRDHWERCDVLNSPTDVSAFLAAPSPNEGPPDVPG